MPPPAFSAMGRLIPRAPQTDGKDYQPGIGVTDAHGFNNTAFFVLFGIIGAAFVCCGIWFFFWAKNGGFYFKEGDWDEYKSTVLRRKGPNGTTLSGATESTILGGGSVYKDVADHDIDGTVFTEGTALSGITGGVSDFSGRERRKALRQKKIKKMQEKDRMKKEEKRAKKEEMREKDHGKRRVGRDGAVVDEDAEDDAEDELRRYRHEKPARVGGLNCESEGSNWDASTNPTESTVSSSLLDNQQATPTNSPTKKGGIRKVYSTADRNDQRERERMRAEARAESRRRREGRSEARSRTRERDDRPRREFSYTRAVESANAESAVTRAHHRPARSELSALTETTEDTERSERRERRRAERAERSRSRGVPGGWGGSEVTESDLGTRSYHHPIPELRSQGTAPRSREERQRERRRRERSRGGYERARQDDSE